MSFTRDQILALDHLSAAGFQLFIQYLPPPYQNLREKTWTLRPLSWAQRGRVYMKIRSLGMGAYLKASGDDETTSPFQRTLDINALAYGLGAQIEDLGNPVVQHEMTRMSLEKDHPKESQDDQLVGLITQSPEFGSYGSALRSLWTDGPFSTDATSKKN